VRRVFPEKVYLPSLLLRGIKMQKSLVLAAVVAALALSACGKKEEAAVDTAPAAEAVASAVAPAAEAVAPATEAVASAAEAVAPAAEAVASAAEAVASHAAAK
jgi:hypothetical protein